MAVGDTYILDEKQGKTYTRIDTKANWAAVNPVLGIGEMGIEKDGMLRNIKIGDGLTPWNSLVYVFKSCPYEIGDILVTMNATDPAVRWPGTTWEVFAPGRVLIGAGTGKDSRNESKTFKVGDTGGEYNHQLTTGEMPKHQHYFGHPMLQWSTADNRNDYGQNTAPATPTSGTLGASGGYYSDRLKDEYQKNAATGNDEKHNIIQPFYTVFYYRRLS